MLYNKDVVNFSTNMLENNLKSLGFGPKESQVYLSILSLGQAKAGQIAKTADINRTTVYDILSLLMQKGLINKFSKGSQTYFAALDPSRLLTYVDREIEETTEKLTKQRAEIEKLLPEIKSLQHKTEQPKVQFFEGEKGMREAYEDTLTADDGILAYANVKTMHEGLPNFFPTYYIRRAKSQIFLRAIMPQNKQSLERAQRDQEEMRDSRFLTQDQTFTPEMNIYNNKVLIASWKEKMAVIIESKELADLQRVIFHQLWNTLPRAKGSLKS